MTIDDIRRKILDEHYVASAKYAHNHQDYEAGMIDALNFVLDLLNNEPHTRMATLVIPHDNC